MVKNPPANVGDMGPIPGSGRSPGERNGNLLQYSCLGNPTNRGPAGYSPRGHDLVAKQQQEIYTTMCKTDSQVESV